MVTVTLTGQQMPLSCDISEEAMAEGAKVLGEKVCSLLACSLVVFLLVLRCVAYAVVRTIR